MDGNSEIFLKTALGDTPWTIVNIGTLFVTVEAGVVLLRKLVHWLQISVSSRGIKKQHNKLCCSDFGVDTACLLALG